MFSLFLSIKLKNISKKLIKEITTFIRLNLKVFCLVLCVSFYEKTFVVKYLSTFEVVTLILLNTLNLTDKIVSTFLFWMFQFVKLINKVPSLQWTNLQYLQLDSCHSGKQLSLSLYISKDVYFLNTQTCTDAWDAYTHMDIWRWFSSEQNQTKGRF